MGRGRICSPRLCGLAYEEVAESFRDLTTYVPFHLPNAPVAARAAGSKPCVVANLKLANLKLANILASLISVSFLIAG